ncbi:MAG: gluconokinase [Verrucomicrobiales bacterium]
MATTADKHHGRQQTFIFMGVSGCGKSTIGRDFAAAIGGAFLDGDDFHPPANIDKMSNSIPLTDTDRAGWIAALREAILGAESDRLCVACSALKRIHREMLRDGCPNLTFIYLHGSRELLASRLAERSGHFMPPGLLDSQLADLEPPTGATRVEISSTPEEIVRSLRANFAL